MYPISIDVIFHHAKEKKPTGEIGKEWLSPESIMMESTLALAGRYSDGGGREDDIPNQILSCVA